MSESLEMLLMLEAYSPIINPLDRSTDLVEWRDSQLADLFQNIGVHSEQADITPQQSSEERK